MCHEEAWVDPKRWINIIKEIKYRQELVPVGQGQGNVEKVRRDLRPAVDQLRLKEESVNLLQRDVGQGCQTRIM